MTRSESDHRLSGPLCLAAHCRNVQWMWDPSCSLHPTTTTTTTTWSVCCVLCAGCAWRDRPRCAGRKSLKEIKKKKKKIIRRTLEIWAAFWWQQSWFLEVGESGARRTVVWRVGSVARPYVRVCVFACRENEHVSWVAADRKRHMRVSVQFSAASRIICELKRRREKCAHGANIWSLQALIYMR